MISESFGFHYPFWLAPTITLSLLSLFLFLSKKELVTKVVKETKKA
jgi:hypothetical protein